MTFILIPLKRLKDSKTRLSKILTIKERIELTIAMLKDVVESVIEAKGVECTYVINNDKEVVEVLKEYNVETLKDPGDGFNNALSRNLEKLEEITDSALILPSDIPLLNSEDIECLIDLGFKSEAVICPSSDLLGTNALMMNPPTLFPPSFGIHSFKRHTYAACNKKVKFIIFRNYRISFDIDNIIDLKKLLFLQKIHHNLREYLSRSKISMKLRDE